MKSVLLVQSMAKQYRVPFFDKLHTRLDGERVRLRIAYSDSPPMEQRKADDVLLDPAYGVRVPGRWLLGERLHVQPVLGLARRADLVIIEQANKQLANFVPLLLRARIGRSKLAFWGQGRNVHCDGQSLAERVKARCVPLVDWWFAYTRGVADYVISRGVQPDVVTVVQNAIDTRELRSDLASVSDEQIAATRAELGIGEEDPVGLLCCSLYAGKKIDFLIDAAHRIRAEVPGFRLLLVGAGPAEKELVARAAGADWIHFLGRRNGAARAVYFRLARVFLIPAWVGLSVVDAFAAGLPVVTTDLEESHSVEIEYVEDGVNGIISAHDTGVYAMAVARLLRDRALHERLAAGARRAGDLYTIEAMVDNFAGGVLRCLGVPEAGVRS